MSVKIGLLTKTPVTQVTFEWLLFIVDVTDMSLQVRRYAKGSVTVFASTKKTQQSKWVEKNLLVSGNVRFDIRNMKQLLDSASVPNCSSLVPIKAKPSLKSRQVLPE